jgi:hypothetical protein
MSHTPIRYQSNAFRCITLLIQSDYSPRTVHEFRLGKREIDVRTEKRVGWRLSFGDILSTEEKMVSQEVLFPEDLKILQNGKKGLQFLSFIYATRRFLQKVLLCLQHLQSYTILRSRIVAGFPPRRPGFEPGSSHVGSGMDRAALEQVCSEYFCFPATHSFHKFLHSHHHLLSRAGILGQ